MSGVDLSVFPGLPRDAEGPVFAEPWQAQAFALVVKLQREGVFTADEWAHALGAAIEAARAAGDPDLGDTYYQHWLSALETLTITKGLANPQTLAEYKQAAHEAQQALHHGHDHGDHGHHHH